MAGTVAAGGAPPGRAYLSAGGQAALIRWLPAGRQGSVLDWGYAHVLVGPAVTLPPWLALLLPVWDVGRPVTGLRDRLKPVTATALPTAVTPEVLRERARSAASIELIVPLLEQILAGGGTAVARWTRPYLPEAVLWGLEEILDVLQGGGGPLSFLTFATVPPPRLPGLLVSFHPQAAAVRADPRYEQAAIGLATSYADAGPAGLHRLLAQQGVLEPADRAVRTRRLLELWPGSRTPEPNAGDTMNQAAAAPKDVTGSRIVCPVCLSRLDWAELPLWRWDGDQGRYLPLEIPERATAEQRARAERGASVRCPDPAGAMDGEHYLPVDYGRHGTPAVLAFIGTSKSGKSHLLTAMIGAIERGGLEDYGIRSRAIDHALHKTFLDERVRPLISDSKVLPPTKEGVVNFVDAFLIGEQNGAERTVALFDVAGGDLNSVHDAKRFLEVADGLIFVADPTQFDVGGLGDETFNTVLGLLESSGRLPQAVSAAIVLNKADVVRFDDPVTRWLRHESTTVDAAELLRESADVFAFLHRRSAQAWTLPYSKCAKATLHAASATGGAGPSEGSGGVYPRGVTPQRVLRPFVALLAMTGVLTSQQAQKVGI